MKMQNVIPQHQLDKLVINWLSEDVPSFDIAGAILEDRPCQATIIAKAHGIVAGIPFVDAVFKYLHCTVEWHVKDGHEITQITTPICKIKGLAKQILLGERIALNALARCSGVATMSNEAMKLVNSVQYHGLVAGTRKTTPGFRLVEKYGMLVGGVDSHRMDLSSMVMLKDNHIDSLGSIKSAVAATKKYSGFHTKIEVECRNDYDATEAIQAGADVIMLDNFSPENAKETAKALKQKFKNHHFIIEVSGGISLENIKDYCGEYIDVISTSAFTQRYSVIDFSLKVDK
eukprot:NODE_1392_length_1158_cov_1.479698.p1 type:complete len:288 gc:universal NODE_1392_length_1158_cov_1.479698:53-916(+)